MCRSPSRWPVAVLTAASCLCCFVCLSSTQALAQDLSNPFGEPETSRPPPKKVQPSSGPETPFLAPMGDPSKPDAPGSLGSSGNSTRVPPQPAYLPDDGQAGAAAQAVERIDLAPVVAADGSGLPYELWNGLTVTDVEDLLAKLDIPPRSPALHALWRRLITSAVAPPSGSSAGQPRFAALRAEVLYRSGLAKEAFEVVEREPASSTDAMLSTIKARLEIGQGRRDLACSGGGPQLTSLPTDMPAPLKKEAVLIGGYCAAAAGDMTAAGLKAGLARDISPDDAVGVDALEAVASGAAPMVPNDGKLSLLDYRIFELGKADVKPAALSAASPALVSALALDQTTPAAIRLPAAEAAAAVNAITPDELAAIYRTSVMPTEPEASDRHADTFRTIEAEHTPAKKTRLIRAFLEDQRRAGLYWPTLIMMEQPLSTLQPAVEIGWFSETAIEISLAAGRYDDARKWAELSAGFDTVAGGSDNASQGGGMAHWLALADVADPSLATGRAAHLGGLEALAGNGRIDPNGLHRLVTVLDALEIQVPIPLWDKASRTPQPNTGYLPETGVLSQLQDASKKKEFGRTVLLAMRALGPNGADSANLIALGDSIRALRRAGLEPDARRLGFEALFASWPRAITN